MIVDSPAAGHGVGILRTPRTFAEIARVGPIAHQGRTIAATIADRDFTAVVAVATAEEMPVNETLWLQRRARRGRAAARRGDRQRALPGALPAGGATQARVGARAAPRSPLLGAALGAALSEHDRAARQREQLARLADGLGQVPLELPYLFAEQIGLAELELLADGLERARRLSPRPSAADQRLSCRDSAAERRRPAPARSPDSIAPSMNPAQPSARSEPASSTGPRARRIAAWWCSYQPGRWIAQVPRENSSASQSCAVASSTS